MTVDAKSSVIGRLTGPIRTFSRNKIAGAVLLMAATVVALLWANSPWAGLYHEILATKLTVGIPQFEVSKPLLLWINDGLMGIFFFLVGLEIKREVLVGELSQLRQATLPVAAAVGGMIAPALVFLAIMAGREGASGWGVPMATDIAFALGVLALLGDRVPVGLKVVLTALAIVDDIGAILVIAVFYSEGIAVGSLVIGGGLLLLSFVLNRLGMRNAIAYFLLGALVWLAFLKSGVHATLAAVLMAFTIPARTRIEAGTFLQSMDAHLDVLRERPDAPAARLLDHEEQHVLDLLAVELERRTAPLQRIEHALVPIVAFVVMPVFALANAGVSLGAGFVASLTSPLALGIVAGLFVGKQLGVLSMSWLSVRLGVAELPEGVTWRHMWGISLLAGIGFTMALFVSGLAFDAPANQEVAKIGILTASLVAGVLGYSVLRFGRSTT